jgi:DNA-binding transcriptional MerR regulator
MTMHSLPADYQQALSEGWLPIRDVARETGVNPVTLRAWERRYGLIVPGRTEKGHRLYNAEHVAKIQAILTWLNRGVAVSQVSGLLERRAAPPAVEENLWDTQRQHLLQAIAGLNERQLDDSFNACMALYPVQTLCEQLLLPLQAELEQRWQGQFGSSIEQVFWHSWLRSKLGARIYHHNRQHNGAPLLLINLSSRVLEPGLWFCAWLAAGSEQAVQVFDWPVPAGELSLALDSLQPSALLFYSSQRLDPELLRRHLPRLASSAGIPLLLGGPAASIHAAELADLPGLQLFGSPAEVLACLDAGRSQGSNRA